MSFTNHETFIRETTIRADKFIAELIDLFAENHLVLDGKYATIEKFIDQFNDMVVFAGYQKPWLEEYIREFYYQVNVKLGQHNTIITRMTRLQKCPICKKRVFSILSPNDSVQGSRTSDYRIICLDCQWTYLLKDNLYSQRQSIYAFLKKEREHFREHFKLEV